MACAIYEHRPLVCRLDSSRPEKEQEKWCKLMEENSELYVSMLERG